MKDDRRILLPGGPDGFKPQTPVPLPPQQQPGPPNLQEVANRLVRDVADQNAPDFQAQMKSVNDWKVAHPKEEAKLVPGQRRTLARLALVAGFQKKARALEETFKTGAGSRDVMVQHDGGEDPVPVLDGPGSDEPPKAQVTD